MLCLIAAMGKNQPLVQHDAQIVVGQFLYLLNLMRSPKAVEEMNEWHSRLERGCLRNQRHVHGFLNACTGQERQPVARVAITSEWSPKIGRPCVAIVRAAT